MIAYRVSPEPQRKDVLGANKTPHNDLYWRVFALREVWICVLQVFCRSANKLQGLPGPMFLFQTHQINK